LRGFIFFMVLARHKPFIVVFCFEYCDNGWNSFCFCYLSWIVQDQRRV